MFPYLLVECEFNPFATIFIETLEVAPVYIDSLTVYASQTQENFDLAWNIITLHYSFGFFFPIF